MYPIPIIRSTAPNFVSDWRIGYINDSFRLFHKRLRIEEIFCCDIITKTAMNSLYLVRLYFNKANDNESEKVGWNSVRIFIVQVVDS